VSDFVPGKRSAGLRRDNAGEGIPLASFRSYLSPTSSLYAPLKHRSATRGEWQLVLVRLITSAATSVGSTCWSHWAF